MLLKTADIKMTYFYIYLNHLQVSGDNPVFVESVKPGGAAEIAGLVAGDMILRVSRINSPIAPSSYILDYSILGKRP